MTKTAINSAYPVQAPLLSDNANIIAAIQLYHIGEGGTVESPTSDSITSHLIGKANSTAPTITGTATFNDNVVLGSSSSDLVTINANVSAATVNVTPTQISYLGSASNKTGTANLVFSTSPSILTPSLDTPTISNTATFNDNVVLGSSDTDTVTLNANISANALVVTPTQISYLNPATGTTGSGNIVYSTSPTISTSIVTQSTTFNLLNINATTINFGGAATTVNVGASTGTTTIKNELSVVGNVATSSNISANILSSNNISVVQDVTVTRDVNVTGNISANIISANNISFASATLATSGTVNLDFITSAYKTQAALTGTVTYTASNYGVGRTITVRVTGHATSTRTLVFPSGWVFVGAKPTSIAATKTGILTVTSFGTTEADCVAAWAVSL